MSYSYREDNIRRKAVQKVILDVRPVKTSKTNKAGDWLVVMLKWKREAWCHTSTELQRARALAEGGRFKIIDEYRSEEVARKAMERQRYGYAFFGRGNVYVVSRDLYDRVYKDAVV